MEANLEPLGNWNSLLQRKKPELPNKACSFQVARGGAFVKEQNMITISIVLMVVLFVFAVIDYLVLAFTDEADDEHNYNRYKILRVRLIIVTIIVITIGVHTLTISKDLNIIIRQLNSIEQLHSK